MIIYIFPFSFLGNGIGSNYYNGDLYAPPHRIATPIMEEGTEPPILFSPTNQGVQLERRGTVPQQQRPPNFLANTLYPYNF